jgi:hypothetical protein
MRSLLLVESFDFRPSDQYILTRVNPSCFRFANKCLSQVSLLPRCNPRYLTYSLGELHIVYMDRVASFSSCSECYVDRLGSVSFVSPFLIHIWIASRLVCSLCEAMAGSLSVAATAIASEMVDSGEVGRSALYSRYNNSPRTLPWTTPALTGETVR